MKANLSLNTTLAIINPILLTISCGIILGFSAILLPQLERDGVELTINEASLLASIIGLLQVASAIIGNPISERIGRCHTLSIFCIIGMAGWIIIAISKGSFPLLLAGRMLTGLSITPAIFQLYMAEIVSDKYRAAFGAFGSVGVTFGIFLVYILGWILHWTIISITGAFLFGICFLLFTFVVPESPKWLFMKGKVEKSKEVVRKLYNKKDETDIDLILENWRNALVHHSEQETEDGLGNINVINDYDDIKGEKRKSFLSKWIMSFPLAKIMSQPAILKSALVTISFCFFTQSTGNMIMVSYSVQISRRLGFSSEYSYAVAAFSSLFRVCGSTVAFFIVKRFRLRVILISSSVATLISMAILPFSMKISQLITDQNSTEFTVLNITSMFVIISYIFAFSSGIGSVAWVLPSEIVPLKARDFVSALSVGAANLSIYLSVYAFNLLRDESVLGEPETFAALCFSSCVVIVGITVFFIPETKGISDHEIATLFESKRRKKEMIMAMSVSNLEELKMSSNLSE